MYSTHTQSFSKTRDTGRFGSFFRVLANNHPKSNTFQKVIGTATNKQTAKN